MLYQESLTLVRPLGYQDVVAWCLVGVGRVAGAVGQPARAARLLSAAATLFDTIGVAVAAFPAVRTDYDRYVAVVRAQLDEAAFAAAWAEGQAMTLEEAIAYALTSC